MCVEWRFWEGIIVNSEDKIPDTFCFLNMFCKLEIHTISFFIFGTPMF